MPNPDRFDDEHPRDRWRDDDRHHDESRGPGPREPRRSFGGQDREEGVNDRRFGADNAGAYSQGGEAWSDTSNRQSGGRGFTGGGFSDQGGYGAQWGKAGYGPLSQGSSYNSDGAQWGRGGYGGGGGRRSERDQREDSGFYGQGGERQWAGGQAGRGHDAEGDFGGARDLHDHEPGYRNWREQQLAGHDRDYRRWRETQARKYDEDYGKWRGERHDAFSRDFHDWRTKNASPDDSRAQGTALTGETARSADAQVQSIADGGDGKVKDADRSPKSAD